MLSTAAVAWLPWRAESFARARAEGRPVLLSIAPTWCANSAEMDAATFADSEVAGLITAHFVAIRVDPDRRPDIAERYSLGGWPTTAFLTPDGDLLGGGTFIERRRLADVPVLTGPGHPTEHQSWAVPFEHHPVGAASQPPGPGRGERFRHGSAERHT